MSNLTKEEKGLLKSIESGEWETVEDLPKRKAEFQEYAKATLKKDKRVNIRISARDLQELQRIAIREGLPYQTLIASILHKYINGVPVVLH
ncbi:MAG: antitoxin [Candidatus Marinimicrobia bacterium]|nr:antitoxin [Candidatus Neomarinimicrobiota bacterium]